MVLRARKGERIEKHHDVRRGVSFGDPAEIRTPDTLLKRQVLCQLSYWVKYSIEISSAKSKPSEAGSIWKRGTAKRVRFDF